MTAHTCPVKGCGRVLGTTRNGDPQFACARHYARLTNSQMARLWRTYRTWKRLERQLLRMRSEEKAIPAALLAARAEVVSSYIDVRNECLAALAEAEPRLELAQ